MGLLLWWGSTAAELALLSYTKGAAVAPRGLSDGTSTGPGRRYLLTVLPCAHNGTRNVL